MTAQGITINKDQHADVRADRRTFVLFAVMIALSCLVQANTTVAEYVRYGVAIPAAEVWANEVTSHGIIFALLFGVPALLSRCSTDIAEWPRTLAVLVAGYGAFAILHVLGMAALREALFPVVVGYAYPANLFSPSQFGSEVQKDLFVYASVLIVFVGSRLMEQWRLESRSLHKAAQTTKRIALKSGGQQFYVPAKDILWAKAASNYSEIYTPERSYFARVSLSALETLLAEAGDRHVRVHRSYIVNLDAVREISATGEGDVQITLSSGDKVPGSRRYKFKLTERMVTPPRR